MGVWIIDGGGWNGMFFQRAWDILLGFTIFLSLFVLASCTKKSTLAGSQVLSYGLIGDTGGFNDESFNQGALEGLKKVKLDTGVEIFYVESQSAKDYGSNLQMITDLKPQLVFAVGYTFKPFVEQFAQEFPQQNYVLIDDDVDATLTNALGVQFASEQGAFLVGYIAASLSQEASVGFIGGTQSAVINRFEYGFRAGIAYARLDKTVVSRILDSFSDVAKARSLARLVYLQGVDIIFAVAGAAGAGILDIAKERGLWVIGVDREQRYLAPEVILTSVVKNTGRVVYDLVEKDSQGADFPGEQGNSFYGLDSGAVYLETPMHPLVSDELEVELQLLKQQIVDGQIQVPYTQDQFISFLQKYNF